MTTLEGYKQDSDKIDLSVLTPDYLAQFDGVMLMTNGNLPLTPAQKKSIVDYVRNGKALIGAHCATLTLYDYPEFGEVIGGYYRRSIVPTNRIGTANLGVLKVEDSLTPGDENAGWELAGRQKSSINSARRCGIRRSRPRTSARSDACKIPLAFTRNRVHVLLSLDTEKSDINGSRPIVKGGDYPQAWTRTFGSGRVVLHRARTPRRHLVERSGVPRARHGRNPLGAGRSSNRL